MDVKMFEGKVVLVTGGSRGHIRVSYILPGSMDTEFCSVPSQARSSKSWKLLPEDISAATMNLLQSHPRSLSSRVEIRASEPKN